MAYIGNQPSESFTSFATQEFSTSATTSYTLDHAVTNENEIALFINNVRQQPGSGKAYTATGTALTLSEATASTDTMYCVFLGRALQTVTPATNSITAAMISDDAITPAKANFFNADTSAADLGTGLHVKTGDSGVTSANTSSDELIIEGSGTAGLGILTGSGGNGVIDFGDSADNNIGRIIYNHTDNELQFIANASERMRVTSDGSTKISKNGVAFEAGAYHQILGSGSNSYELKILNKASSPASQYITEVSFANSSPDGSGAKFFQMRDSTTARVNINSDGDLQNHDNSYGAISDERIKQNIVDAGSQWEDIKNIRVRKYKKKDDVLQYGESNAPLELGVISQELESVSPGLIKEDAPDSSHAQLHDDFAGNNPQNVKYVKYSILYMKAIKALQEAQTRIETLEAKVTALENA